MSNILEVKNLTHKYSGQSNFINDAVSNISFGVEAGEIIPSKNGVRFKLTLGRVG